MIKRSFFLIVISLLFVGNSLALDIAQIVVSSDGDAEENISERVVNLQSSDLELGEENSAQIVGLRFDNLKIPKRATILKAWVQFVADESSSEVTDLIIEGERTSNSLPFISVEGNISARIRTDASVVWQPSAWETGDSEEGQSTPDIQNIIQEIVSLPDWELNNHITLMVRGSGKRVAVSYDGNSSNASKLYVTFSTVTTSSVNFSWLPNTDSANGYAVHYGVVSGNYTEVSDAGFPEPIDGRIHHTVNNIPEGQILSFAATAYDDSSGTLIESDYSTELSAYIEVTQPGNPSIPQDVRVEVLPNG